MYIQNKINKDKKSEMQLIQEFSQQNNIETIAIVIDVSEYSNGSKKFLQDQYMFKGKNLQIYILSSNNIIEFTPIFYFDNNIYLKNLFYNEFCYTSNYNKNEVTTYVMNRYTYDNIFFY